MRRFGRYLAAVAAFGFGYVAFLYLTLPDVRELRTRNLSSTAFMDLRAREAREQGREVRRVQQWIPYASISPHLRRAVLVAEDAGFWGHEGIDLVEIRKSLETDWETGSFTRGASTITQQLAKNLYLSPSRNPFRKLRELWIARRLENELSKTRILRAVPEQHRMGRRHLGRRSSGTDLLRHLRFRCRPGSGRSHGRCHRQSARAEHCASQRPASGTSAHHSRAHGIHHTAARGRGAGSS